MTRETDSSSSGAQGGRGGAAYPSGTQPYGSRPFPSLHPQERTRGAGAEDDGSGAGDASGAGAGPGAGAGSGAGAGAGTGAGSGSGQERAAQPPAPDEPRTETTLTTRIRINIPGSRPIPPVVVRTPVDEATAAAAAAGSGSAADQPAEPEAPEPEPEPEKTTSDWFAPRKPAAPQPAPQSPPREEAAPGAASTGAGPYLPPPVGGVPGEGEAARGPHDTPAEGFASPFAAGAPPFGAGSPFDTAGTPGAQGNGPYDTGAGPVVGGPYDTGSTPVVGGPYDAGSPVASGPYDTGSAPLPGGPSPYDTGSAPSGYGTAAMPAVEGERSPYDTGSQPFPGAGSPFGTAGAPRAEEGGSPYDTGATPVVGGPYDTGSTPVPGAGPSPYGNGSAPSGYDTAAMPAVGTGAQPFGTDDFPPGVPRPSEGAEKTPFGASGAAPFGGRLDAPSGPTAGPATGSVTVPPLGPEPGGREDERVSGDTLVSGIPAVSSGGPRGPRQAAPHVPAPAPEPAPAPAPAAARPAKKGRSKPVLLVAAVGVVLAVAYGAGLLMNHADVPKGTTVIGVDIGNQDREAAVKMLDDALGTRPTAPVQLTVGGKKQSLKPSVAGLSVDTDATVRGLAHADYNPVSVIGSLFGGSRTADPVFVVDEDKLKSALQALAGKGGAGSDAMVRFEDHKAVAVPGTARTTFDVAAAAQQVEAAYRTRVETGTDQTVALSATTQAPKVSQAELDAAVNGFGRTAMSGRVTIKADGAHVISFDNTLPKFLTMTATPDGKLAPHIDLVELKKLYKHTFDGVLLERGNGSKTPVTPQDVATALIQALNAKDPADRTVTFPNVA